MIWTACFAVLLAVPTASAWTPVENVCVPAADVGEWCGDGGPADRAGLVHPTSLDVLPDGTVVIFDSGTASEGRFAMVRAVTRDGIIHRVAGTGAAGESGDGGPAVAARIAAESSIAGRLDGSFLLAEADANRVRRVTPDGRIETVAGTGVRGSGGDGGAAVAAQLDAPASISTAPDGGYFLAHGGDGRIRRVAPDGTISTVGAVTPRWQFGESLLRLTALANGNVAVADGRTVRELVPNGTTRILWTLPRTGTVDQITAVAQGADGRLLVLTTRLLLRLEADGRTTRLAGTTDLRCHYPADGGPAARLTLALASDMAVDADAGVLVADWQNGRVRRIAPDGSQSLFAGGAGSRKGGNCGFGAGETDMDSWAVFLVTRVWLTRSQITVKGVSTLPARVDVTVRRRGHAVLRAARSIRAGEFRVVLDGRFSAGRYRVSLAGRGPRSLSRSAHGIGSLRR
jgi:hypothetical protein